MDSFELNKIIGAVLGTLLFVMGVGFVAEAVYEPIEGIAPGYELPEPAGTDTAGEGPEAVLVADIGTLLVAANPDDGAGQARKCQSCHNFQEGGPNGQGPNLYGVVGRPVASHEGFQYSDAMKQHATEIGNWTYEALNEFLTAPKQVVPNTKMNFGGVKNDQERANIIGFLSTLSATPVPFPAPEAPAADAAPETTAPAETPTATQGETPVAGTATGSNTPAGAETPGAGGTAPATPAQQPTSTAPVAQPNATPATQPPPVPSATITPPPAPTGSVSATPETPTAPGTTTTTTAQ